ncbi:hypothetical protein [Vibrio mediterranei]|uniref:hypothetical protein n=1 Tax=Vibrio mediterranei TaxID=689 RepID=UPI004068ED7F
MMRTKQYAKYVQSMLARDVIETNNSYLQTACFEEGYNTPPKRDRSMVRMLMDKLKGKADSLCRMHRIEIGGIVYSKDEHEFKRGETVIGRDDLKELEEVATIESNIGFMHGMKFHYHTDVAGKKAELLSSIVSQLKRDKIDRAFWDKVIEVQDWSSRPVAISTLHKEETGLFFVRHRMKQDVGYLFNESVFLTIFGNKNTYSPALHASIIAEAYCEAR